MGIGNMSGSGIDQVIRANVSLYPAIWVTTFIVVIVSLLFLPRKSTTTPVPSHPAKAPQPQTITKKGPVPMGEIRVSKILIHPIKSCRGVSVREARYTPEGLERHCGREIRNKKTCDAIIPALANDRKWCIINAKTHAILTAREFPKMVLIEANLNYDSNSPYGGELVVSIPRGDSKVTFSVPIYPTPEMLATSHIIKDCLMFGKYQLDGYVCQPLSSGNPHWPAIALSAFLEKDVYFVMKGPAIRPCDPTPDFPNLRASHVFQDGYPLLVLSEESLEAVGSAIQSAASASPGQPGKIGGLDTDRWKSGGIEIERFRPNIVVRGAGIPFAEDMWHKIVLNNSRDESRTISLVSKCARCLLPNVDTKTGVRDAAVPYKVIMKFRTNVDPQNMNKPCIGCNGVPGGSGVIRVGDLVTVEKWA